VVVAAVVEVDSTLVVETDVTVVAVPPMDDVVEASVELVEKSEAVVDVDFFA
jgi:hypothetical protein